MLSVAGCRSNTPVSSAAICNELSVIYLEPGEWAAVGEQTVDSIIANNEIIAALCGGDE
jgi:hypothetical protein